MHNIADLKAQIAANLKVISMGTAYHWICSNISVGSQIGARTDRYLRSQCGAGLHELHSSSFRSSLSKKKALTNDRSLQDNAEQAVKDLLKSVVKALPDHKEHTADLHAVEYMDDGSRIALHVQIDGNEVNDESFDHAVNSSPQGKAKFDFTGTSEQVWYNWNAPRSISYSAIIYCLRAMIAHEIPLNQVGRVETADLI